MKTDLVRPLEYTERRTWLSHADGMMSVMTPTVALCYRERLDAPRLRRALARVFSEFSGFAGRIRRSQGALYLEHGVGGATFEIAESRERSAALGALARAGESSQVCPNLPVLGTLWGLAPVFAARITQTPDGSVLGVTWNHALGDHYSALLLLRAWVLAYRDQPFEKPLEVADRGAYLREQLPEAAAGASAWRVLSWPDFVRQVYSQFWMPRPLRRVALEFSAQDLSAIHAAAASTTFVTAHDTLCAHVFLTLRGLRESRVSPYFGVALNYRKRLGLPANLLGNLSDVVNTEVGPADDTAAVASALRDCYETFAKRPITQRDLASFKAEHPSPLRQMRCTRQLSDPYRINVILSSVANFGYFELAFESSAPAFVHARGTNLAAAGFGTIVKNHGGAGATVDIVLPARLAERMASQRGRASLLDFRAQRG